MSERSSEVRVAGAPAGVEFTSNPPYLETVMKCNICQAMIFTFNLMDTQEKMAKEAYWHTMSQEHMAKVMDSYKFTEC